MPMIAALGTTSCNSSSRFGPSEEFNENTPVILPPGRLRLATRPPLTGSMSPMAKTIGSAVVSALAAKAEHYPRPRQLWPRDASPDQRPTRAVDRIDPPVAANDIAALTEAVLECGHDLRGLAGDLLLRNPTTGIPVCCAYAATGHVAAAPPRRAMNSRRLISSPRLRTGHRINPREYSERGGLETSQCPLWVKSGHLQCKSHVRFTPESGHVRCTSPCLLCANSGHAATTLEKHLAFVRLPQASRSRSHRCGSSSRTCLSSSRSKAWCGNSRLAGRRSRRDKGGP